MDYPEIAVKIYEEIMTPCGSVRRKDTTEGDERKIMTNEHEKEDAQNEGLEGETCELGFSGFPECDTG